MTPDDLKELAQLIQLLRESPEIGSIEIAGWFGKRLVVTRSASNGSRPSVVHETASEPAGAPPSRSAAEAPRPAAAAPSTLKEIKSPMVGTFYSSPEPGADAYVKVGSRISAGQTVCIIEAMKIMNEIEAEFGGVVKEIAVENSQAVEFGQVLFRVEPHG